MVTPLLNNRYQIIETLGRGSFGETFLAKDTHMPSARNCVIKHLKPVLASPEIPQWLRERFQREATILEELGENHPQIPNLYAYFSEGDDFYLVQEWIPGLTLGQAQEQRGNFSSTAVEELLLGILPILDFIHQRRIIHRDIKPDNIILRQSDGQPILIDFGIIKETMGTLVNPDGRSAYSVAIGTPGYMAPEQAAGRPVFSSDLYSLGLTAIFLVTGKSPQYLKSDSRTGEILWQGDAPYVSPSLAAVLSQAIRYHPRERFKSAKEMRQALLGNAQLNEPVASRSNYTPRTPPTQQHTAPTLVVGGNQPRRYGDTGTTGTDSQNFTEYEEDPSTSPIVTWFVMPLVFLLVIVGGIVAGFWVANQRRSEPPVIEATPTPIPTLPPIESTPDLLATPEPTPRRSPRPTPVPPAIATPEPTPDDEVTPTVEDTPIPDDTTPSPVPDVSPEVTPPVNQTPVPIPVITPPVKSTPKPKPTPQATPKPTPQPTPKPQPTPTPPPTKPLEVIPPPEDPTNNSKVTPPAPPAAVKKTDPGEN